jgi:rare lipoprotein A
MAGRHSPGNSRCCGTQVRNPRARKRRIVSKAVVGCLALNLLISAATQVSAAPHQGWASYYGEAHRGKLMANGKPFNPDKFTAASWFYPLGTKVRVTLTSPLEAQRSVVVTITDRGPDKDLVRDGRIIDLSHAPFKQLAPPYLGLVAVAVRPLR